jgi:hypothetical protein
MFYLRKMQTMAVTTAVLCCFAAADKLLAATAPNVNYTATGVFATNPVSGSDLLELAGQPFTLSVVLNEATKPTKHSKTTAEYTKVPVTGTVQSRLIPGTPIPLAPGTMGNLSLVVGAAGQPDALQLKFPQNVVGVNLTITAKIMMPNGTITTPAIKPFTASVTLTSSDGSVSYADTTATTVLGFASGTLSAVKQ